MTEKKAAEIIEIIKKSTEEIGKERLDKSLIEFEEDLKNELGEEKYRVYLATDGKEDEEKLIEEIGKEKFVQILDEINAYLSEKLNK